MSLHGLHRSFLAILCLAAPASLASADTILSDDFETGNTAGNPPAGWATVNAADAAPWWHKVDAVAQSPFSGGTDANGVFSRDERNSTTSSITRMFATAQTDALTIEFDFRFTSLRVSPSNNNDDYVFQLLDSTEAVGLQLFLSDAVNGTAANVAVLAPGTPANTRQIVGAIARDQWYRVRIETDATGAGSTGLTADISLLAYVSGSEKGGDLVTTTVATLSDVPLLSDIDDYAGVRFTAANDAAAVSHAYLGGKHLDNINVTSIPEPAAGAAAVLGTFALLRVRR